MYQFPVKTPKKTPIVRHLNYLVISFIHNGEAFILMRKRIGNDIWKNMYDFPCIETELEIEPYEVIERCNKQNLFGGLPFVMKSVSELYMHQLTHRTLYARFLQLQVDGNSFVDSNIIPVKINHLKDLPIPRLIDRYLSHEILR